MFYPDIISLSKTSVKLEKNSKVWENMLVAQSGSWKSKRSVWKRGFPPQIGGRRADSKREGKNKLANLKEFKFSLILDWSLGFWNLIVKAKKWQNVFA